MESENCKVSRWQMLKNKLNNLEPEDFRKAVSRTDQSILIDVRTAAEFNNGHLPGAIHIDYFAYDFWDRIEQLDPQKTYFIYCRSGRRSIRACTLMRNGGFNDIYNLEGGILLWEERFGQSESSLSQNIH